MNHQRGNLGDVPLWVKAVDKDLDVMKDRGVIVRLTPHWLECQSRPPSAQLGIPAKRSTKSAPQAWAAPGAPLAHFHSLFKLSKRGTAVPKLSSGSNQSHRVREEPKVSRPIPTSCFS